MKINELLKDFSIFTTNEERAILESINDLTPLSSFDERGRVIIANLVKKSLITKVVFNGHVMVKKNEL